MVILIELNERGHETLKMDSESQKTEKTYFLLEGVNTFFRVELKQQISSFSSTY